MQVVEQQQHRGVAAHLHAAKQLGRRVKAAAANLPAVGQDRPDVAAGLKVQPDQVAEQMRMGLRQLGAVVGLEQRRNALFELALGQLHRVGVVDLEAPREDVAQQAVGLALRLRRRTAAKHAERFGACAGPGLELVQQPALADTGLGHDSARCEPAAHEQLLERMLQRGEFGATPDHARFDALDAARRNAERARPHAAHQVGHDGFVAALHQHRRLWLQVEQATHLAVSVVADAQGAGRRRLLHARGHVDGHAADRAFVVHAAAEQHAAGVDAQAHVEAVVAVPQRHQAALAPAFVEQGQAGAHCALGVVFVRLRGAEHGQQAVARVLEHLAVVGLDDDRARRERSVHHGVDVFRVEVLAECGGADDVEEQHRHLPQGLPGRSGRRAGGLQPVQRGQALAQRSDHGINRRVAQQRALGFQRGDGAGELLKFGGQKNPPAHLHAHCAAPPTENWGWQRRKKFVKIGNSWQNADSLSLDEETAMLAIAPHRAEFRLRLIAGAGALLLIAAAPARAQFYDYSGAAGTFPVNFFPINKAVASYDFTGNVVSVGAGAVGSFSALAGSFLKADGINLADGGIGNGTLVAKGTRIELGGDVNRLQVGNWGTGTMTVSDGAVIDATVNAAGCVLHCSNFIGNAAGSTGALTITGAGSEVRTLRNLIVGQAAVFAGFGTPSGTTNASVSILNGGTLRTENASVATGPNGPNAVGNERVTSTVTIDGAGSRWIATRNSVVAGGIAFFTAGTSATSQATINITNGGSLRVDGTGSAGPFDAINLGANGGKVDVIVSGTGSSIGITGLNNVIQVGRSGAGTQATLSLLAGGTSSTQLFFVGRDGATGTVLIDGAGSTANVTGVGVAGVSGPAFAIIGRDGGNGSVTVSNGGRMLVTDGGADSRANGSSPGINLGHGSAGSAGSLTITGAGSTVQITSTSLGLGAGVADNYNPYMSVGRDAGSSGQLTISTGGKLLMTGNALTSLTDPRYTGLIIGGRSQTDAGGNGQALVTGLGSEIRLTGTDAYVSVGRGPSGTGLLQLANQGHLESTGLDVGWTGGRGTMTMDNATARLSGGPYVDGSGAGVTVGAGTGSVGALTLSNGSKITITSSTAPFGMNVGGGRTLADGTGTLTLQSGSTLEITGTVGHALSVGRSTGSVGTALIAGGSSVDLGNNGSVLIGRVTGATGTVRMSGASTLNANYVGIGSTPGVDTGTGTLVVSHSTVTATTVEIGLNGTLGGNEGTINGTLIVRGTLSPGESPGRIIVNGAIQGETTGKLVLDVESDGNGGFLTDSLVLTKGTTFDFGQIGVEFNFIGDADPTKFGAAGKFDLDTFLLSRDGSTDTGLSSVFASGTDWGTLFTTAQFSARSAQFDITSLGLNADGSFAVQAAAVPEPGTWALMLLGSVLLIGRLSARQRCTAV